MTIKFGTQRWVISALVSVIAIAPAASTIANPAPASLEAAGETHTLVAQAIVAMAGSFVAAEAPTTGAAQIVIEGGHAYLEIDSAFSTTDMAPDLQVLLDTSEIPPQSYDSFNGYVNLGSLQNVSGAQRYPIPDAIDIAEFNSVVIWCRMANATMGYASLVNSQRASLVR